MSVFAKDWSHGNPRSLIAFFKSITFFFGSPNTSSPSKISVSQVIEFLFWVFRLKLSRSRNKIVEPWLLPKKERTNLFFYPDDSEVLETWISSVKYFKVEKQIRQFVFLEKLWLDNFVSISTDFYNSNEVLVTFLKHLKYSFFKRNFPTHCGCIMCACLRLDVWRATCFR